MILSKNNKKEESTTFLLIVSKIRRDFSYASKISKILMAHSLMMLPGPKIAAAPAL